MAVFVDQGSFTARLAVVAFCSPQLVAFCFAFGYSSADNSHGGEHVSPAVDDSHRGGSESKKNDDDDAVDVYLHVRIVPGRFDCLLACQ